MSKLDVLAFGAHPDDVELGCGGTMHKLFTQGYQTGIVDLTRGEMGTRGTVEERDQESKDAAEILGASIRLNLDIPDGNIENSVDNQKKIISVLRTHTPDIIFAPYSEDRHPDHVAASKLITESAFYAGLKKKEPSLGNPWRTSRVIYYMMTYEFTPSFTVDVSEHFEVKIKAVNAHTSQFHNPDYDGEETFISSQDFFDNVTSRARHFGWQASTKYAEAFFVREMICLEDVFSVMSRNKM